MISRAVPGAIAASATQVNIFVSGILVSQVNGARSWLAVCDRLYQLPLALVGVAVGVALLPRLSRAVHAGDRAGTTAAIDEAMTFSLSLTLPAAVALTVMPYFLIDGLYTRGAFTHLDAWRTAQALQQYGWGVPAFVLTQLTSRAFFAHQDTRTPMRFALISVAVNIVAGVSLFQLIGVRGIAMATSLAAWVNLLQMVFALMRRRMYRPSPEAWARIGRVALANLALALLIGAAAYFRSAVEAPFAGIHLGHAVGAKEIAVLLVVGLAMLIYAPLLFAFGGLKLSEFKAALRRRPKAALEAQLEDELGETPAGPDLL